MKTHLDLGGRAIEVQHLCLLYTSAQPGIEARQNGGGITQPDPESQRVDRQAPLLTFNQRFPICLLYTSRCV